MEAFAIPTSCWVEGNGIPLPADVNGEGLGSGARLALFHFRHRDAARRAEEVALRGEKFGPLKERGLGVQSRRKGIAQEMDSGRGLTMREDLERLHDYSFFCVSVRG